MGYYYPGMNPYYPQPMQDNLMQLRNQFQPPQPMQPQDGPGGKLRPGGGVCPTERV